MKVCIYILVMAVTTYLIRALPLVLLRKPIKSRFIRSFLHYVPVACLSAMTFPAILYTTDNVLSGALGLAVAVVLALWKRSLLTVALASCATVFLTELILHLI
jgi:branched-subunit amino acid transport protein